MIAITTMTMNQKMKTKANKMATNKEEITNKSVCIPNLIWISQSWLILDLIDSFDGLTGKIQISVMFRYHRSERGK